MATKTITTDDLDGSPEADTITFSFDGRAYEIDLGPKNRKAMEKALKPYTDVARATGSAKSRTPRRSTKRPSTAGASLTEIREWASANGHRVSTRGRIAQEVVDAYNAAR